jgi:TPP-dependent pyruvate/acetoin dehydrogenase alpha subunit
LAASAATLTAHDIELMVFIRCFEANAALLKAQGAIPGSLHDCAGQEAVAVGVCSAMEDNDVLFSGHRGIGHALARGINPRRLLAELMGLEAGFGAGNAGGMHIFDRSSGILGTNGIVGASLPIAVGAALTFQTLGKNSCSVVFFGEGAITTGAFHEALYLAGLWKLPVLFICEHNGYVEFTPSESLLLNRAYLVGDCYDVESFPVDGADVRAVNEAAHDGLTWARSGHGPALLDCRVYRFGGHYEGDTQAYRHPGESLSWQNQFDPITRAAQQLELDPTAVDQIFAAAEKDVSGIVDELRAVGDADRRRAVR